MDGDLHMKLVELFQSIIAGLSSQSRYLFRARVEYKSVTEKYPDTVSGKSSSDLFVNYKGYLRNDLNKCSGCAACLPLCSVSALSMDTESKSDGSFAVKNFKIHLGRCFSCSVCIEACPESSLSYSKDFELVSEKSEDLVMVTYSGEKKTSDQGRIRTYEVRR
jgi:formate hydrogenlyase subunit 6/NADH:ubiquinone oxidoreductase subunit I